MGKISDIKNSQHYSNLVVSWFGLSHHWGDNVSGSQIAQSVEHSHCKRGVPSLSPSLTAHFSHPVTFAGNI